MPNLGQIFYGRGPDGYGVLGVSPTGRPFIGAVASLCRAVGSPDRPGEIPTFLLGKREGNAALMIRACRGAADPTGRSTIFFHALVGDADALRQAGLDAFSFADDGTFTSSCSARELPDLVFPDVKGRPSGQPAAGTLDLPATISSDRPLDALVRRELGVESLDRNWATFSFNPLPGFDLCVLSSYSPRKGNGTQYAFDGAELHRISPETMARKSNGETVAPTGQISTRKKHLALFVSLAVNAILVLALLVRGSKDSTVKPVDTPSSVEMSESDARVRWEAQWKSEWEQTLPPPKPDMTEAEAKARWERSWKAQWEQSLPPPVPAMTEAEAKAKWETQWKSEWEKTLPPRPSAMTEAEARAEWESKWQDNWKGTLRRDFETAFRSSGGAWPIPFNDTNSPFFLPSRDT